MLEECVWRPMYTAPSWVRDRECVRGFEGHMVLHPPHAHHTVSCLKLCQHRNTHDASVQFVRLDAAAQDVYTPFVTSVPIACGEELTFDYNTGTDFVRIDKAYFKNESAEPVKQHVRGKVTVKS